MAEALASLKLLQQRQQRSARFGLVSQHRLAKLVMLLSLGCGFAAGNGSVQAASAPQGGQVCAIFEVGAVKASSDESVRAFSQAAQALDCFAVGSFAQRAFGSDIGDQRADHDGSQAHDQLAEPVAVLAGDHAEVVQVHDKKLPFWAVLLINVVLSALVAYWQTGRTLRKQEAAHG